jgi:hypothetical protein
MPQGDSKGTEEFELNGCRYRYYGFEGIGTVDLVVKSKNAAYPDYTAHFTVVEPQ